MFTADIFLFYDIPKYAQASNSILYLLTAGLLGLAFYGMGPARLLSWLRMVNEG